MHPILSGPVLLTPSLFTAPERTPWGGLKISQNYKRHVLKQDKKIGESWEFSCDPELPSTVSGLGSTLQELIDKYPTECLGPKAKGKCEILVRLLDAAEPLSLQIHPEDDDADLKV